MLHNISVTISKNVSAFLMEAARERFLWFYPPIKGMCAEFNARVCRYLKTFHDGSRVWVKGLNHNNWYMFLWLFFRVAHIFHSLPFRQRFMKVSFRVFNFALIESFRWVPIRVFMYVEAYGAKTWIIRRRLGESWRALQPRSTPRSLWHTFRR